MTIGRVYTTTGAETTQNHNLIQGTSFTKGRNLNLLYNSSTTHSFISNDCVKNLESRMSSLFFYIKLMSSIEPSHRIY